MLHGHLNFALKAFSICWEKQCHYKTWGSKEKEVCFVELAHSLGKIIYTSFTFFTKISKVSYNISISTSDNRSFEVYFHTKVFTCITEDFLLDCVHHKESRKIILIFLTSDAKELNKNILGQGHFNSTSHKIYLIQKVRRLRNILSNMKSIIGCSNTFQISGISTLKTQSNPRIMDSRFIRISHCYGEFALSLGKESLYIFSKIQLNNLLIQTLFMASSVSILTGFDWKTKEITWKSSNTSIFIQNKKNKTISAHRV